MEIDTVSYRIDHKTDESDESARDRSPRTPSYIPMIGSSITPFTIDKVEPIVLTGLFSPPIRPMSWIWQCHLCHQRYALGVTRRCLHDGHYYCAGDQDQRNNKRKRSQSCSSEFDYFGWRLYGEWRRNRVQLTKDSRGVIGCERCEFPSQCRYKRSEEFTMTTDGALSEVIRYYSLGDEMRSGAEKTTMKYDQRFGKRRKLMLKLASLEETDIE